MDHTNFLVPPGQPCRLRDIDPQFTSEFENKSDARHKLESDIERLAALQDVFFAARTYALLVILQGMDAAGKDSAIKHVMSGLNPQGVAVFSFKAPSGLELGHDYLWRAEKALPERGRLGIFNRSYYEEVLVVRIHPDFLAREGVPDYALHGDLWADRFEDINAFERHLFRNGTHIVKIFLHVSKTEQRKRLLERVDDPAKNWKFSSQDVAERLYWDRYQQAYEEAIDRTSTEWAPWYVIPADRKWFVRAVLGDILVAKLDSFKLHYPTPGEDQRAQLAAMRSKLEAE